MRKCSLEPLQQLIATNLPLTDPLLNNIFKLKTYQKPINNDQRLQKILNEEKEWESKKRQIGSLIRHDFENLIQFLNNQPKNRNWFKTIKSLIGLKKNKVITKVNNSSTLDDKRHINKYYQELFTETWSTLKPLYLPYNQEQLPEITLEKVVTEILKLAKGKAVGPDGIAAEIL